MTFLLALQFLTTIPLGRRQSVQSDLPGRSMAWFPGVGLVIGSLLVILDALLSHLWSGLPGSALLLIAWLVITGGMHMDGFIDCCDGLLVERPAEQRLAIMKDSRVGAFGVLGAIGLLLVKFSSLAALTPGERGMWLLLVPSLSRWIMVWAAWRYPTARPEGFAVWFRQGLGRRQLLIASGLMLAISLLIGRWLGVLLWAAVWLCALLLIAWVMRRIPGLTGDVYGALNETSEAIGLLLAVLLQRIALG